MRKPTFLPRSFSVLVPVRKALTYESQSCRTRSICQICPRDEVSFSDYHAGRTGSRSRAGARGYERLLHVGRANETIPQATYRHGVIGWQSFGGRRSTVSPGSSIGTLQSSYQQLDQLGAVAHRAHISYRYPTAGNWIVKFR